MARDSSPRIAVARCRDAFVGHADDARYFAALAAQGARPESVVWDDPEVDWSLFDAVHVRTTWDYFDRPAQFVAWTRAVERCTRLFNSAATIEWNADKTYLRDLAARGLPTVPTEFVAASDADAVRRAVERFGTPAFLKPSVGANAAGASRIHDIDEGIAAATALSAPVAMIQPYLTDVESEGERSLIVIDGTITHAVRKRPRPGDFRVQDDHGATDEAEVWSDADERLALAAWEAVPGDPLLARIDLMPGAAQPNTDARAWLIGEVEAIEPSLFFRHAPQAAERLASALLRRLHPGTC